MRLYLLLDIVTIFVPLILSWDKKVRFYKQFKALFIAICLLGIPFILWDVWFTYKGVWGFNGEHLLGVNLINLPIEEVLFFIVVPYACVFLHDVLEAYWPIRKEHQVFKVVTILWLGVSLILTVFFRDRIYTLTATLASAGVAMAITRLPNRQITSIWRSFIVTLIPFLIINGILTGGITETPVVWYDNTENMGIRLGTIPLDDIFYKFSLITGVIVLRDHLLNRLT